jgi:asparagine synthase (glutamine-hydrolysing)
LGGDEIFAGYNLFRRVPRTYQLMSWLTPMPVWMRKLSLKAGMAFTDQIAGRKAEEILTTDPGLIGIYFHYRRLLSNRNLAELGLTSGDLELSEDFQHRHFRYEDSYVPGNQVSSVGRLDSSFYLQNILLRDSDVFGMANSLEIRVPFLDRDLAEWAMRLPGAVLLPPGMPPKYLLRKICADFYTPSQLKQSKHGFALPFSAWLQGPLRELMTENLLFLSESGIVDPAGIESLRNLFNDQPDSPAWSRVWALVVLGSWLRNERTRAQRAPTPRDRRIQDLEQKLDSRARTGRGR